MTQTARYDRLVQRIHVRFLWSEIAAGGSCRRVMETHELSYIWRDELLLHLELAGFEIEPCGEATTARRSSRKARR